MEETTPTPEVFTGVTQESFDSYVQQQSSYNQFIIFGLAVIAGCIIASVVMRFFHRD